MSRKKSLKDFQERLARRLAGAGGQSSAGLLGVQSGQDFWVLDLADSGEILPLTPLTEVPLTKPWFQGVANIRGRLYSVSDFSSFRGGEATPKNNASRLLLIGMRYGNNAALLVTRVLGLRNQDDLTAEAIDGTAPDWAQESFIDREGRRWKKLYAEKLLADDRFMDIGV